jgi:hypothetical protein
MVGRANTVPTNCLTNTRFLVHLDHTPAKQAGF